jgi:anthranilate phosphoribosyltransferase
MFAPKFHPAMKYASPIRKSLAMRTIFNILGPLTNPAGATAHVLGVFDERLVAPITQVMYKLGAEHAYVVYSEPGIDEIVPISRVYIGEVANGTFRFKSLTPEDFGVSNISKDDVRGGTPEENVQIAAEILTNKEQGVKRQIVVINATYAIHAAGIADSIDGATDLAIESMNSGAALEKLGKMVSLSGGDVDKFYKAIE